MTHWSHNEFHLGDNLIHLHFLRKLAMKYPEEQFRHAIHPCHREQLAEAIEDVPNVQLIPLEEKPLASVNVWKNAGATVVRQGLTESRPTAYVPGFWEQHRFRNNYAWFYIDWFEHLAAQMGLENPIKTYRDLWFDYPKLHARSEKVEEILAAAQIEGRESRVDFLIVNSQPCSGQFRAYDSVEYLSPLIEELAARYSVVVTQPVLRTAAGVAGNRPPAIPCTRDYRLTISEIGALSLHADHLLMVSTGPSWPTFNIWNEKTVKLRLLLLDTEVVDYMPNLVQANHREAARAALVQRALL
jgi:hypothetical protein